MRHRYANTDRNSNLFITLFKSQLRHFMSKPVGNALGPLGRDAW